MLHDHAVVWIDHREAHVQSFTRDASESSRVKALGSPRKIHHRAGSIDGAKAHENRPFFALVAEALNGAKEVLIVGPAQAKDEFVKYLGNHLPQLAKKVIGVETADHPSDGQLLEHARRFFLAADRMLVQPGSRNV